MNQNQTIPREIIKWLDSLDLAYSVRNVRRDLQNGFIIAEILSRYYPKEVSIYSYDNGLNLKKKKDNWEQIAKLLAKKDFTLTKEVYEPIYNLAENAAIEFLETIYEFLTRKKLQKENKPKIKRVEELPSYAKSTAAQLAKTRELTRIVDEDEKKRQTALTIAIHDDKVREEKQDSNIIEYLVLKRRAKLEEQLRQEEEEMLERKRKYNLDQTQQPDVKEIQLKSFKSSTSKKNKEQQGQLMEAKGIIETLQENAGSLLKKDFVEDAIRKLKIDKKNQPLQQLFNKCDELKYETYEEQNVLDAFLVHFQQENSLEQIIEMLNNNFIDFKKFFFLFLKSLESCPVGSSTYTYTLSLFKKVATPLCDIDPQTLQLMFESILLEPLLKIVIKNPTKRESLIDIFYYFCQSDSLSRLHLINKIKQFLSTDLQNFLAILSHLVTQDYQDFDNALFDVFYDWSFKGLYNTSPFTRTNSLKIINEILHHDFYKVLCRISDLHKLVNDDWWEVNAQILIICSKLLLYIHTYQPGDNENDNSQDQKNSNDSYIKQQQSQQGQNDEIQSVKSSDQQNQSLEKQRKEQQEFLMQIIYQLFRTKVSQNILRIGLIYLAPIIRLYPELCDRYLDILLEIYEKTRVTVLMTETPPGMEEGQVVNGYASFKYKLTSAPEIWNSVGIAQSLDKYARAVEIEEFQKVHLEILIGCLYQQLQEIHAEPWIEIYENINKLIFIALCDGELCILASDILKKLFLFAAIQKTVLEVSFELFSKILQHLFHPDIDEQCKENLLEFFEFLIAEQPDIFHEYIFDIIKNFSEDHKSLFLKSNLIEFMNSLAKNRRNKMFQIDYLPK